MCYCWVDGRKICIGRNAKTSWAADCYNVSIYIIWRIRRTGVAQTYQISLRNWEIETCDWVDNTCYVMGDSCPWSIWTWCRIENVWRCILHRIWLISRGHNIDSRNAYGHKNSDDQGNCSLWNPLPQFAKPLFDLEWSAGIRSFSRSIGQKMIWYNDLHWMPWLTSPGSSSLALKSHLTGGQAITIEFSFHALLWSYS